MNADAGSQCVHSTALQIEDKLHGIETVDVYDNFFSSSHKHSHCHDSGKMINATHVSF